MKQKMKLFEYLTGNPRKHSMPFKPNEDVKNPIVTELHLAKHIYAKLGRPTEIEIELSIEKVS